MIPVCIGVIIIIVGIIIIYNQESEITKSIDEVDFENKTLENQIIDERLDEIEKNAMENNYSPEPREWITSGPFQIDRSEYRLGEKIFIRIGGLDISEKGQIAFLRPLNETHYSVYQTIPFDGKHKNAFNYYVSPGLSSILPICTAEEIVGDWVVVFRGTEYPNINFKIINQTIPGDEKLFEPIC